MKNIFRKESETAHLIELIKELINCTQLSAKDSLCKTKLWNNPVRLVI